MSDEVRPLTEARFTGGNFFAVEDICCGNCGLVKWVKTTSDGGPTEDELARIRYEQFERGPCTCPRRSYPVVP